MTMTRVLVVTDADNTLWDTNQVYANAQLAMLHSIEKIAGCHAETDDRLQFIREVDQELARVHHRGLRYPPAFLAVALTYRLRGTSPSEAAKKAWKGGIAQNVEGIDARAIEQEFIQKLKAIPKLREGVNKGLMILRQARANVLVLTEGPRDKCIHTLKQTGIFPLVDSVIESRKNEELFHRLARSRRDYELRFMIGDQLDRDIIPAKKSGFTTICFPGGFQPNWTPQDAKPDYWVSSFAEAACIVAASLSEAASSQRASQA